MAYKLVALDIDGTIRNEGYPLSDRTRRAIDNVRDAGAVVTLATGRTFRSALEYAGELQITSPVATFQGAHLADPSTGEVLWHRPLTPDMARSALEALGPWDREIIAHNGDQVYVNKRTPWLDAYELRNGVEVQVTEDFDRVADVGPTRLVVVGDHAEIERLEERLLSRFDSQLYITRSLPHFCEILHPDSGKQKALALLCDRLGLSAEETVAFGNGYNDVPMVSWAGLGVAVEGAVPQVLEAADRIASPVEEDGAAQVLEELLDHGLVG